MDEFNSQIEEPMSQLDDNMDEDPIFEDAADPVSVIPSSQLDYMADQVFMFILVSIFGPII